MSSWFEIDRAGLAAHLERRGKSFAVFELIQNAWDSGSDRVNVELTPCEGKPYATLSVEDFSPEGFVNLDDAFTMFARSSRATDPTKRGRFNLGEKTVIALCSEAMIMSTTGTIHFTQSGRRHVAAARPRGTQFTGTIRMTRDELQDVLFEVGALIPPVPTLFNGNYLSVPKLLKSISVKLPTEIADDDGVLRRVTRETQVAIYDGVGVAGQILEMGIPVVEADLGYRVNVLQKVPLNIERDNVPPSYLKALRVAVVNAMHEQLPDEAAAQPWVQDAVGDGRISKDAFVTVQRKRFGDRAVVAVPGDPIANASAEAAGFTVIHGGAMSGDAWSNARKFESLPTASAVFPSPKAAAVAEQNKNQCPSCGRPL